MYELKFNEIDLEQTNKQPYCHNPLAYLAFVPRPFLYAIFVNSYENDFSVFFLFLFKGGKTTVRQGQGE